MSRTEIINIRISTKQKQTLKKLEKFDINVSQFIRDAIAEKIKRDYKNIVKPKILYVLFNNNNIYFKPCQHT
jgi:hypothetical protein